MPAAAHAARVLPAAAASPARAPIPVTGRPHLVLHRGQRGVRKLGGGQQRGHVALVAVSAERLVEQKVE